MKIALIGAGGIGSRHIQSIVKLNNKLDSLFIIEPSEKSIYNLSKIIKFKSNIFFYKKIIRFKVNFDFLIISTNSDIRKKVFEKFIEKNNVRNIIFEKIAFTNTQDYLKVINKIKEKKINAYINLPRRTYLIYKKIYRKVFNKKNICFTIIGHNWNLSTNLIHNIDLFYYLTNSKILKLKHVELTNIRKKNNNKFIDFNGSIEIENNKNDILIIKDLKSKNNKFNKKLIGGIKIEIPEVSFFIFEDKSTVYELDNKNCKIKKHFINIPMQSELTHKLIENFNKNKFELPSLEENFEVHKILLRAIKKGLVKTKYSNLKNLPIT